MSAEERTARTEVRAKARARTGANRGVGRGEIICEVDDGDEGRAKYRGEARWVSGR